MTNTMSNIPDATESRRLDDLTAYNSTILAHLHGGRLECALLGHVRRLCRTDAMMRQIALDSVHPDDLADTLVLRGYTLASVGIESISVVA